MVTFRHGKPKSSGWWRIEPDYRRNHARMNGNSTDTGPSKPAKRTSTAGRWREVARYPYVNRDGNLLFEVIRYLKPDGTKTFIPVRPSGIEVAGTGGVGAGGLVVGLNAGSYFIDPKWTRIFGKPTWTRKKDEDDSGHGEPVYRFSDCPRVPYRLPKLLNAESVFLVEGERDVHTLEEWGLVACCNPGGSGSSGLYSQWADYFRGRHIVVLPDNDEPGWKHAAAVAAALLSAAASLRIAELPDLPAKGDVTAWRDAGGTFEQFHELTEATTPLDTAALSELRARWGLGEEEMRHQARAEAADDWPKPEPIQSELPPVEAFCEDLLPDSFRPLVADMTERMQVPIDYLAVVMVLCLAGAVNRRAAIQPKAQDSSWIVVPNLWGGIVGPPGVLKSPVIRAVSKPLRTIEELWRNEFNADLDDYGHRKEEADLRLSAWKDLSKQAFKKDMPAPIRPDNTFVAPVLRRIITNDATYEKLHELMSQNPAGLLVIRDELTGWWSMMDKPGREGERAFSLECWNGDSSYTADRIIRGTVHVPYCCISMLGGIQPGRLRSYLTDALIDGPANDGLIQRFQLLVWPETSREWNYVDRPPDGRLEQQVERVFRKLVELDADAQLPFRFARDAQELFIEWLRELEAKVRGDELHPALISHLSKYRSLMPSLALLFELADLASSAGFDGSPLTETRNLVSLGHTQQAAAWCEYLESHARRIYSCVVTPQMRAAQGLAEKIKHRRVGGDGSFSCREVYTKGWSGLDSPEAVRKAAEILHDSGWVRELPIESGPLGGRPSSRYAINPRVWE